MKNLTGSKAFLIVVSLLLSFALWLYVVGTVQDEVTRTFTNVRVDLQGEDILRESKGLVVTDLSTNAVSFAIVGPRRIVSSLSSDDLVASVDVSKLGQSAYASMQYSIVYPSDTDTSGLSVGRKVPDSVNFMVSKLVEKEIPVRGSFDGSVAEGYTSEAPEFEPASILISGAEAIIKNVSYAWVSFRADQITTSYSENTGYTLMDEDGNEIPADGITVSTDIVKASLPILEVKDVMLSVNLVYGAGADEKNVKVTIEPETVTLAGDSAILDGINKLVLDTIDLSSFDTGYTETYPVVIDNELTNVTGVTEAKVTVEVLGTQSKTFKVTNFGVTGLTDGFSAEIKTEALEVKVRGTAEALEAIKAENIRAVADLTDYFETTGLQMVPVKISIDGVTDAGAVGSYTISVEIAKEQG